MPNACSRLVNTEDFVSQCCDSIARIVKARCAAAGVDPREFAGYSLRAGMVTSAAEKSIAEWRIRVTSRRKSDVLRQYIRPVEKRQHALTNDVYLAGLGTSEKAAC
jgi:hypothetical protein